MTPPIRGGVYLKEGEASPDLSGSEDERLSVGSAMWSLNSSSTSLDTLLDADPDMAEGTKNTASLRWRKARWSQRELGGPTTSEEDFMEASDGWLPGDPNLVESYTAKMVQKEIDDDIRIYPSLDSTTQQDIDKKFQALHERVKIEGFYDCHFQEYAKELCRYTLLFAIFLVSLRYGWYMTSAAFLGLFWVSLPHLTVQLVKLFLITTASNHVHSSRCRPSRHHPQLRC